MAWLQLLIDLQGDDIDAFETTLLEQGAQAVTLQDAGDDPVLEPPRGTHPLWPRSRLVALFDDSADPAAVLRSACRELARAVPPFRIEPLVDTDWERAWMQDVRPARFGRRLWVCPRDSAPPDPEAVNVMLDPGLAFGTGTHPTTALCLEWLDGQVTAGIEAIDYGCGSGILSIAAARLGAGRVWAVDNDPQALLATRANVRHNRVPDAVRACLPEELPAVRADLLVANILATPLVDLASLFASHVRPGGSLALSGILADQANGVVRAFVNSFRLEATRSRDEWILLSAVRREP